MSAATPLPRIAVVGVSSLIGAAVLDELRARKIAVAELHALDDERSGGTPVSVSVTVEASVETVFKNGSHTAT